jgi:hypothetical protein
LQKKIEWKRGEKGKWEEIEIKIEMEVERSRQDREVKRKAMKEKQGGR